MRITIFPNGSRGDVQPYVALGMGLKQAGYDVSIPATAMFRPLITEAGLDFREMDVPSPQEMVRSPEIQAAVRKGGQIHILTTLLRQAGPMMESLFEAMWQHSHDAEAIIATTFPWGAIDIAQKRGVPAIWCPLHPMQPTNAYPNPFITFGKIRKNHPLNVLSFHLTRQMLWQFFRGALNRWRSKRLNLPPLPFFGPYRQMEARRIPVIYGFSEQLLARPAEWPAWHTIAGWWFLDHAKEWQPPQALTHFLGAGSPPVYIGFGSMDDQRPERIMEIVIQALEISGQRGIIQSGWMGLDSINLPESIMHIDPLPHSWLFPRVAAVVHHGGAGTTAAGVRAGVPSIITPVGGDQPFWAQRMEQLGVGFYPGSFFKVTAEALGEAIRTAATDPHVRQRAAVLGAKVREEDGVGCAVGLIQQILS